jgi:transcriptional regulator with AAA-type ATPase domain
LVECVARLWPMTVDELTKREQPALALVPFDPITTIFAAPDERKARACLDHYRDRLRTIELMPLARRRDDVPHLLQFEWATELGTVEAVESLGAKAVHALTAYDWPHNLEELIDHAPRLLAYHQHGGLRPAAAAADACSRDSARGRITGDSSSSSSHRLTTTT